jgi:hypothetical protein
VFERVLSDPRERLREGELAAVLLGVLGEDLGDTSSLEDPSTVEAIEAAR